MRGHVRDLGDGRYQLIGWRRDPLTGRLRQKTKVVRGSRRQVDQELHRFIGGLLEDRALVDAGYTPPSPDEQAGMPETLAELVEHYIAHRLAIGELESSTARTYRTDAKKLGALGATPYNRVATTHLDQLYRALLTEGGRVGRPLSGKSVDNLRRLINAAYRYADRKRWLADRNPNDRTETFGAEPQRHMPLPSPTALTELIRAAEKADPELGLFIVLTAILGTRTAELCALRWDRVDLDELVVTIDTALAFGEDGWYEKEPKAGSKGRIPIDPHTADLLRRHRTAMRERCLAFGCTLEPAARVFSDSEDSLEPWNPKTVARRFDGPRHQAGLGELQLRDLRRWTSSTIQAAGKGVAAAQQRLRHKTDATTRKHYTQPITGADRDAAQVVAQVLYGDTG